MQSQTTRRDFRKLVLAICIGYFFVGLVTFFLYTKLSNRIDTITDQVAKQIDLLDKNMSAIDRQIDTLKQRLDELGRRLP